MSILTNVSWLARHPAVFAAGVALIAATNVADARGSGGSASHSSHSFSAMPMKQGKSYQSGSATGKKYAGEKHEGKKHEGKKREGEAHEGKDHSGSREGKNGCKKHCEGGKDSIVITNGAGKVLYRLPKQQGEERETAQAIPGGILITIGNNSYKIAGTSVTVKNFALSQYAADKAGLTQTIKRNKDGTISDVLTVAPKPPLKGI
jgi:hypothetical protein